MIDITNISSETPFKVFKNFYNQALKNKQLTVEAMTISSIDLSKDEVDSRYVNLKYINNNNLIFFTNYNSPKAIQLNETEKVSLLLYWNSINVQIRIKGIAKKTSSEFSDLHFNSRSDEKNALAISSKQSQVINSYQEVTEAYEHALTLMHDKPERPPYWGGYEISPYYFEFWEGHKSRLNKRISYELKNEIWKEFYLQP